jgi:hypothetical protein
MTDKMMPWPQVPWAVTNTAATVKAQPASVHKGETLNKGMHTFSILTLKAQPISKHQGKIAKKSHATALISSRI